jgi:hypothetical protein
LQENEEITVALATKQISGTLEEEHKNIGEKQNII